MSVQIFLSLAIIALGLGIAAAGVEICANQCWLDSAVDFLLPATFDAYSGGAPVVVVGLALLIYSLIDR